MSSPNIFYMFTDQTREEHSTMIKPPSEKRRGRKPGSKKTPPKTETPKRGMGILQLERLRLQEKWKNLAVTQQPDPVQNPTTGTPVLFPVLQYVPTHYGKGDYSGPMIGNGGAVVSLESGTEMMPAAAENGGGGFCGGLSPDPKRVPGYNGVAVDPIVLFGSELTSIPKRRNNHYQAESSDAGFKKYHMQDTAMYNNHFQGNNINPYNFNGEINGCYSSAQNLTNESTRRPHLMAIHNKGGSTTFEYDFVLGGRGTGKLYPASIEEQEASFSDSTSIDLSLRL